ncbi:MAG: hypothetical protein ACR2NA_09520 [Solirubrobacterales bacterium]
MSTDPTQTTAHQPAPPAQLTGVEHTYWCRDCESQHCSCLRMRRCPECGEPVRLADAPLPVH